MCNLIWNCIYKIENFIEKIIGKNSIIEKKIFSLFGIRTESCGHYDRFEQCCNDFRYCDNFCENMCPYGIGGDKRLPFSNLVVNVINKFNSLRYLKYEK